MVRYPGSAILAGFDKTPSVYTTNQFNDVDYKVKL